MSSTTDFASNKLIDARFRAQTPGFPTTYFVGLILATKGSSTNVRSAAVASGDTVVPATPNGRIYKCTTAGTCGAGEPTWPTTYGATVTDGTAVWTEQTIAMQAGTFTEVSTGAYARQSVAASLANFAGTQAAGSTVASSGTTATTSNNAVITFPAATADYGAAGALVAAVVLFDALTAGNAWDICPIPTPIHISAGSTPKLDPGQLVIKVDDV